MLTHEEKLSLMKSINWDYNVSAEDMLSVIENKQDAAGNLFNLEDLFARSLERISWRHIVALFGIDTIKNLYTPTLARRIYPPELREKYDFTIAILRGEPIPSTGWSTKHHRPPNNPFLPNRRNRFK